MVKSRGLTHSQPALPIEKYRDQIISKLKRNRVLIIQGETGCGKTTKVPQFLHESGLFNDFIGITQPRRVAAISIARRVAQEMGCSVGGKVGYSVRFQNKVCPSTYIKYLTDGMLIREALIDPNFSAYSVIIIDEAHERSVNTDLLLGMIKRTLKNTNLKLIIMSATLQAGQFATFFNTENVLRVKGRSHPVTTYNVPSIEPDYIDATIITILQIHVDCEEGDILVFLTGQEDISNIKTLLHEKRKLLSHEHMDLLVLPIHSCLPNKTQVKIFEPAPANTRKIILATNIAETSITVPNIKYVVDSCRQKVRTFNHNDGMDSLKIELVSKSSAMQRQGRAGREMPGHCYRLITQDEYNQLPEELVPEIARCNLTYIALFLKQTGVSLDDFDFLTPPPKKAIGQAITECKRLGGFDVDEELTKLGKEMIELPLPPTHSKILINAKGNPAFRGVLTIIAMMNVDNLFHRSDARGPFKSQTGDHMTLFNVYTQWKKNQSKSWIKKHHISKNGLLQAKSIKDQLKSYIFSKDIKNGLSINDGATNGVHELKEEIVIECLAQGFQAAELSSDGSHYRTLREKEIVYIHPSSVLFEQRRKPKCVIFSEIVVTTKKYMRQISEADLKLCLKTV